MVSSRILDSKVLKMVIKFEYFFFFLIRRHNGECNVRNFSRCLFSMSSYVLVFKIRVL